MRTGTSYGQRLLNLTYESSLGGASGHGLRRGGLHLAAVVLLRWLSLRAADLQRPAVDPALGTLRPWPARLLSLLARVLRIAAVCNSVVFLLQGRCVWA